MLIQWFPGHMTKTKRMIEDHLKAVDVVAELLDARIPASSANPMVEELVKGKPRIVILNKADLADPRQTDRWVSFYRKRNIPVVPMSVGNGKNKKKLLSLIRETAKPILDKWYRKGLKNRSVRLMILGIPNVGKSSLINFLAGTAAARTANTPGHTRGKQWVRLSEGLDLLDTPGVLWPKFDDKNVAWGLAMTGAIKDDIFDIEQVVCLFLERMLIAKPELLQDRFALESEHLVEDTEMLIENIARKRGCLRTGGVADVPKVVKLVLREYRDGKVGKFILDSI